jgi:hypothetical protein
MERNGSSHDKMTLKCKEGHASDDESITFMEVANMAHSSVLHNKERCSRPCVGEQSDSLRIY